MCSGDAALVPAGLRGYRMWSLEGFEVAATRQRGVSWNGGVLTAECHIGWRPRLWLDDVEINPVSHEAPAEGCTCGIYGWYRPDDTRLHQGEVFGVIEATGRTLLGDFGFRAEHARVVALVAPDDARGGFAAHWAVRGVRVFATREQLVAAFPPEDVTDLLGHPIPETPATADVVWQTVTFSHIDARAFTKAMMTFGQAFQQVSDSYTRLSDALRANGTWHVEAATEVRDRALARRRQGHRGPVKQRRGRARLSL